MAGIYIHIPFCKRKCSYCDFFSLEDLSIKNRFLRALAAEFALRKEELPRKDTLYIGGGTPSVLETGEMEFLFDEIEKNFGPVKNFSEITVEVNPESASPDKLSVLKKRGVSRLSAGLQSCDQRRLNFLGRLAGYENFLVFYREAGKAGFENISLDLIYGLPGETLEDFKSDLKKTTDLNPAHISSYCLEIHENTPLGRRGLKQDPEEAALMFREMTDFLPARGYAHYEISNFSKKGRESAHNLNYWDRGEYSGFGPSAASHLKGIRIKNSENLMSYCENLEKGHLPDGEKELLSEKDMINETLMLGLRKTAGIELSPDIFIKFKNKLEKQAENGVLEISGRRVKIKKEFLFVSNSILSEIIEV